MKIYVNMLNIPAFHAPWLWMTGCPLLFQGHIARIHIDDRLPCDETCSESSTTAVDGVLSL